MLWLYNALCSLCWPLVYFYPPFRGTVAQRLGNFGLGRYKADSKGLKVLVNAVSAGEVVAIAPFIRELKARLPDAQIALLTTTDSGQEMAQGKLGDSVDLLAYFPLADLWFASRRYLERLKPDVYVTTEAELWPNIQSMCKRRGIPVVLVNARLYLHNKSGLRGSVVRWLYELCDLIVCQDERQRDNFLQFGIAADKLAVAGNTKFDFELPEWDEEQLNAWRKKYQAGDKLIVAGSTHPGEEEILYEAFSKLQEGLPKIAMLIAPRRVERVQDVDARLGRQFGIGQTLTAFEQYPKWLSEIVLIDRYGVLVDFYRIADVVIMGGTFHPKVGGHNVLEATALGKPVVVGPSTFGITAQVEMLAAENAIVQVGSSSDEIAAAIARLLEGPAEAARIGAAAQRVTLANRGAAVRAVDAVLALVARANRGTARRT